MAHGGTLGMNPEQVRYLGTQLASAAGEIRNLVGTLSGQLENTYWEGPDRDAFQNDWQCSKSTQLLHLAEELNEMSQRAMTNAAGQEEESSAL